MGTYIYEDEDIGLSIKRFWGGDDIGVCFQLTFGDKYIQYTQKEFSELLGELVKGLIVE